jgi:hypothetical protein
MTDRDVLLALALRCEAATGPDRELDAEIARRTGWICENAGWWWSPEIVSIARQTKRGKYAHGSPIELPQWTASIDAALPPDGWGYELRRGHLGERKALCRMWNGRGVWAAVAATPALAFCAALLRARGARDG